MVYTYQLIHLKIFKKKVGKFEELQHESVQFDKVIKYNMDIVDKELMPASKKVTSNLSEYQLLSSNLRKSQILLLETEDKANERFKGISHQLELKKQISKQVIRAIFGRN